MPTFPTLSYAKAASSGKGKKRTVAEQLVKLTGNSQMGPFTPSEEWLKFVNKTLV